MPTTTARPPTAPQLQLLARLLTENGHDAESVAIIARSYYDRRAISARIDCEIAMARRNSANTPRPAPAAPLAPGYYLAGGNVWKVTPARSHGGTYASRMVPSGSSGRGRWEYVPGAVRNLTAEHALTADQASEFGRTHGWCCVCGALLTDPDSIARGIGPVCATRF